jgi:hypothetical protein
MANGESSPNLVTLNNKNHLARSSLWYMKKDWGCQRWINWNEMEQLFLQRFHLKKCHFCTDLQSLSTAYLILDERNKPEYKF